MNSSTKNGFLGAARTIRDENGIWVIGFTKYMGKGEIELVEVWSLYLEIEITIS